MWAIEQHISFDFSTWFTARPSVAILIDALTSASILFPQLLHLKCLLVRLPRCLHTLQVCEVYRGSTTTTGTPYSKPLYSKKERSCLKDHLPSFVLNFLFLRLDANLMLVKSSMATPLPLSFAERIMDFAIVWLTIWAWVLSLPESR